MFTDIVGSTSLIEAIGDEAWQGLRRWHDDTLRKRFAEHDGEEVDHAGGGEILASAETLEGVIDVDGEDPREVTLKGITDPVRVVTVGWLRP